MDRFSKLIENHQTYSAFALSPVGAYYRMQTVGKNLVARFAFFGAALLSLAEAVSAFALTLFSSFLVVLTFGKVPVLKMMAKEFSRIALFNAIIFAASIAGAVGHPLGGICIIEKGGNMCRRLYHKY